MNTKRKRISDHLFSRIHLGNIVYNTCWEDPRCDRALLELKPESEVVMITSAGCNALDYLLDDPKTIHCVDVNFKQNALMHLKMAAIKTCKHEDLFKIFGEGRHSESGKFYNQQLRSKLPPFAVKFWDENHKILNGKGVRKSFYYHGTSGTVAWLVTRIIRANPGLHKSVQSLIAANSLDAQRQHYAIVERKLFNIMLKWLINRHLTLSMLGVPKAQQNLMRAESGGVTEYILSSIRHVFNNLPIQENYFWRVYMTGTYTTSCCPNYLVSENQNKLAESTPKIQTHTMTISDFLKRNPGKYSHFVLLDHQDWLAKNNPEALEEEWNLILENSKKGSKVLLRSASETLDFIPEFARSRISFGAPKILEQKKLDRVGTYKGVELGVVL